VASEESGKLVGCRLLFLLRLTPSANTLPVPVQVLALVLALALVDLLLVLVLPVLVFRIFISMLLNLLTLTE
jgi:hypothetical protein